MKQKTKIRIFLSLAIFCWIVIAVWAMVTHQQGSSVDPIYDRIHGDIYATNETISIFDGELSEALEDTRGALLANPRDHAESTGEAIANLANTMDEKTIVIVAFEENIGNIPLTGLWGWQTPYGVVSVDKGRVDALKTLGVKVDNLTLERCEDLGMIMFYCAYYFPGVSVVPVVLDENMSSAAISTALGNITPLLEDAGVLAVSPRSKNQQQLFTSDLAALNLLLSDCANTEYQGIFPSEAAIALKAFGALLPQGSMVVNCCSDKESGVPQYFSDLLLYRIE